MNPELEKLILQQLDEHRLMTVATNRPDGWPQATVVGYVNDGMLLYFFVGRLSQKYANIARDPRVSAAISGDFASPLDIKGLSLAGRAAAVNDSIEYGHACDLLFKRYPEYAAWPRPDPAMAPLIRITPEVFSVLDYSKGFGHSDLVTISRGDSKTHVAAPRHDWLGWLHRQNR